MKKFLLIAAVSLCFTSCISSMVRALEEMGEDVVTNQTEEVVTEQVAAE